AAGKSGLHGLSVFGELKYGPDFKHFDYVNPQAPKGGTLRLGAQGTFDSFNPYIIRGNPFSGIGTETLTVGSADEPFTRYGLIAESMEWPEDRSWVVFSLRPEARWHDGTPITVDDVIFSLETLKNKGAPFYRFYYASIAGAERVGERRVKFTFAEAGNRELPLIAGEMPILSKAYWEGRDFERTTLEPPLTSGPYKVAGYEAGRFVIVERVKDYWGKDLPVNIGQDNFDRIRYEYFRDDTVIRQALKAGVIDYREENQAKAWALDYDVPAVRDGLLKKVNIPHMNPTGMQAFAFNIRRPPFQNPKVREALAYAFDFEWTNRALFFGQYTRTESYFSNSDLASGGLPKGDELAILERYRDRLPERVFTDVYRAPSTDGSGWPRDNLAKAFSLLAEAGWVVRDMKLVDAESGRQMRFEILLVSPAFERIVLPLVRNLRRLGIEPSVRLVDQSQYINRVRDFDFDIIVAVWGQAESPGNEQRGYWSSKAADSPGSRNFIGIKDPVVDELIELVVSAPDRESLVARTRALDRALLWGFYVIPNWHIRYDRILYWDKFSRPEITPRHGTSISYWWYDRTEERRLNQLIFEQETARLESESDPHFWVIGGWAVGLVLAGLVVFRFVIRRSRS
ncbi:MAG: ABC transporter substrate-binding protein, partial [Rhodospirillales bacterium]|nr:ABC transporter substrate-binding protein [Rhodospirillales bacterium]